MLICIKLCTLIGQIDGEVTEIPRMTLAIEKIVKESLKVGKSPAVKI
jgi:hypothetical protein